MKVADLITKVGLQDDRIKILEGTLKNVTDALDKIGDSESRLEAAHEINQGLRSRIEALEEAHPTVLKGTYDYANYPPRPGIPHEHKGG